MIRKIFILILVAFLFIYMAWNFYNKALSYNPLAEVSLKKIKMRSPEVSLGTKYKPAWGKEIYEKNLFNPLRTYKEPKPFVPVVAPVVEPPKRPDMALKGIVLDTFGDYVAYIEIDKAKATPMRKGDKTENIELIDISDRKAVLKWNDEIIDLSIDRIRTITNPRTMK